MVSSSSTRAHFAGDQLIGAAGALLGALVSVSGTVVELRPNRVLGGTALSAPSAFGGLSWALTALWVVALLASLPRAGRGGALIRGLAANGVLVTAVLLVAARADAFVAAQGDVARVTLGVSFWLTGLAVYMVVFSAMQGLESRIARAVVGLSGVGTIGVLLVTGRLDSLSIMQEYAVNAESFQTAFWQQVAYTVGATSLALVLGLIAGVAAARSKRIEGPVFATLNVAQVLPALSFIGLLIVPMGWLGANVPALDAIGVSGIGWAPVFFVLLSYALYPITRNVFTALKTLDMGIVDAATGMGMKASQRLLTVEMPLAFPVVLAGVRIAAVQTTAAAILAALVGGGGLGQIVFFGVQQSAQDLILLGVIPIVAMSLAIDASLRFVESTVTARRGG